MMYLTVVLRKEVADEAQGEALYNIVKDKMSDHPDVTVSGTINSTLPKPEVPE